MDPLLASILIFAGNFAPRGWAFCNGQVLSISQNTALFSLLGTTYGGNGIQTFGLPDLRGRVPIHYGQGPGLSNYDLGQMSGTENVTMLLTNMPAHNHLINANSGAGDTAAPAGAIPANTGALDREYSTSAANVTMNAQMVSQTGGSQPFSIMQPYLALNYIIALQGIFPSRN
jgi:microcystin-dependent protein